jgi:predicted nucleotidyltransferase
MALIGGAISNVLKDNCLVIFYGSLLTDRFSRTSDIDVAVYCKDGLDSVEYLKIMDEIEKLPILREVDLVNLDSVRDADLFENILKKGKIWKNSKELLKDLENRLKSLKKLYTTL